MTLHGCYFDDSNGASVASRMLMRTVAETGTECEVVCGSSLDMDVEADLPHWLRDRGLRIERLEHSSKPPGPNYLIISEHGINVTLLQGSTRLHFPDHAEMVAFLDILTGKINTFRPHMVLFYGSRWLVEGVVQLCRERGIISVFLIHNFHFGDPEHFNAVDRTLVASSFAAKYYREALGLNCHVLPYLIDWRRIAQVNHHPRYITFVNPSQEKGVYPFARIADELGRRRPDIPILVVESRGTEATVAGCGLELKDHGTVHFMAHTADPRDFWSVTKVCLLPSVWWENQPLVAVEAMVNGIPVVGSDRGGIPETLGDAGIVLPLPERITQATRMLPTAEEVAPWVEVVIRLWDDSEFYEEHRRKALVEAKRWDPAVLEPRYVEFFRNLKPGTKREPTIPPGRAKSVVLVPYLSGIEPECEDSLRKLEASGVRVVRSGGNSAIDVARNQLASDALHDGFESIFFIDADLGFDPLDALRLLARPEPVVSGVYAKKGSREFASIFADGVTEVVFGANAFGLYPLKYAATGFLRIKATVLRRLIDKLDLPHCNTHWGRGKWPFFEPMVVPQGDGRHHYLGEDWAFSHRLARIGVTPMADTSIRLWHYGRYAYGWEDAGIETKRFATFTHHLGGGRTASGPASP